MAILQANPFKSHNFQINWLCDQLYGYCSGHVACFGLRHYITLTQIGIRSSLDFLFIMCIGLLLLRLSTDLILITFRSFRRLKL